MLISRLILLGTGATFAVLAATAGQAVAIDPVTPPPSTGTGDGGQTVTISVSGTGVKGGSAGRPATSSVKVYSPCSMNAGDTGKGYYEWVSSGAAYRDWHNQTGGSEGVFKPKPGYEQYKDDDKGHWYGGSCISTGFDDMDEFSAYADKWFAEHGSVYVRANEQPPVPPVPPEILLEAATKAMTLPGPAIDWNPKRNGDAATLVNLDTWVWLTDQRKDLYVAATAGDTTVRVDATFASMTVSAPNAGRTECQTGGVPYAPGATGECTIAFTRGSPTGGTSPVTTTIQWNATWTINGTNRRPIPDPLPPVSDITNIAVREVQAVANN